MVDLAIIGGTGMDRLETLKLDRREEMDTPWGTPSAPVLIGNVHNKEVAFLARHGHKHDVPPHKINYRANLQSLKYLGVKQIVAVAAVGGITSRMGPGVIAIPDQIIDYTHSREHTFFNDDDVQHIDFSFPYTEKIRQQLIQAAADISLDVVGHGTYGATQGPRLETAAEIRRMDQDGCDLVGMTGMPEASLARELDIEYATCAVVANWAAGKTSSVITMEEIEATLVDGMAKMRELVSRFIQVCTD